MAASKSNDRYDEFAQAYIKSLNATEAAIEAGYSKRSAYSTGHRLLKNAEIQSRIEKFRIKAQKRNDISLDRVLQELAAIAFLDPRDAVKWGPGEFKTQLDDGTIAQSSGVELIDSATLPDHVARAISEVGNTKDGVKIKFHDKLAALEKLGKHLGLADRTAEKQADTLAEAIKEISRRGSAAPIATARNRDEDED